MAHHRIQARRKGISIIEALVALAVMAFGMLSMVGVQVTLRLNSDVARQRAEATRIATQAVDTLRGFTRLATTPGQPAWADIATALLSEVVADNTTYRLARTVRNGTDAGVAGLLVKVVEVKVSWQDRTNAEQSVTLDTVIAGVDPAVVGLLTSPAQPSAMHQINGRHWSIPPEATSVSGDPLSSQFTPPGSTGVTWFFNNLTGALRISGADGDATAKLISGLVNFDLSATPDAVSPAGPALNLSAAPNALALVATTVRATGTTTKCYADAAGASARLRYFCAVIPVDDKGWGGRLNVGLSLTGPPAVTVCRYTPAANPPLHADHPEVYCSQTAADPDCVKTRVKGNLINQNFLVILTANSCPPPTTLPHQS